MGDKDKAVERGKGATSEQGGWVENLADAAESFVRKILPNTTDTLEGKTAKDREKKAGL